MATDLLSQFFLRGRGPKDSSAAALLQRLSDVPYPPPPAQWPSPLRNLVSQQVYELSLQAWVPVVFSLVYYVVAHGANHFLVGHGKQGRDLTKGPSALAKVLRWGVIAHNAFLALYSGWTFVNVVPVIASFFAAATRAAGFQGLKLALCSMPINTVTLAPFTWIFYISKYYEVVDSIILVLKGKPVSNLQSYHHAGALLAMWIAYRFQSQAVWVFVAFNSGVHTAMYSYYFCSAMKLPFPKTLKRNLTTLQIAQISSGVVFTNLYWIVRLKPAAVAASLARAGFSSALKDPASTLTSALTSDKTSVGSELFQLAAGRAAASQSSDRCLESDGAALALHFNTMYLIPLVVLFARFFIRSYLRQQQQAGSRNAIKKAAGEAERKMQEADVGASAAKSTAVQSHISSSPSPASKAGSGRSKKRSS
ncbi:unnamed protein product [Parajaminaea phylloscopi]